MSEFNKFAYHNWVDHDWSLLLIFTPLSPGFRLWICFFKDPKVLYSSWPALSVDSIRACGRSIWNIPVTSCPSFLHCNSVLLLILQLFPSLFGLDKLHLHHRGFNTPWSGDLNSKATGFRWVFQNHDWTYGATCQASTDHTCNAEVFRSRFVTLALCSCQHICQDHHRNNNDSNDCNMFYRWKSWLE